MVLTGGGGGGGEAEVCGPTALSWDLVRDLELEPGGWCSGSQHLGRPGGRCGAAFQLPEEREDWAR